MVPLGNSALTSPLLLLELLEDDAEEDFDDAAEVESALLVELLGFSMSWAALTVELVVGVSEWVDEGVGVGVGVGVGDGVCVALALTVGATLERVSPTKTYLPEANPAWTSSHEMVLPFSS